MDFRNFVETSSNQRLVGFNRMRSNWVIEQLKLSKTGERFSMHRIAPRRVIFELSDSKINAPSLKRSWLIVPIVALALAVAFTNFKFSSDAKSAIVTTSVQSLVCDLTTLSGSAVGNLESFSTGHWSFDSTNRVLVIGEFASVQGQAKCGETSMIVNVIANREGNAWSLKKMVPIN